MANGCRVYTFPHSNPAQRHMTHISPISCVHSIAAQLSDEAGFQKFNRCLPPRRWSLPPSTQTRPPSGQLETQMLCAMRCSCLGWTAHSRGGWKMVRREAHSCSVCHDTASELVHVSHCQHAKELTSWQGASWWDVCCQTVSGWFRTQEQTDVSVHEHLGYYRAGGEW